MHSLSSLWLVITPSLLLSLPLLSCYHYSFFLVIITPFLLLSLPLLSCYHYLLVIAVAKLCCHVLMHSPSSPLLVITPYLLLSLLLFSCCHYPFSLVIIHSLLLSLPLGHYCISCWSLPLLSPVINYLKVEDLNSKCVRWDVHISNDTVIGFCNNNFF